MNANLIKRKNFNNMKSDLIITLTYVLMDNFCSCVITVMLETSLPEYYQYIKWKYFFSCRVKVQNLKYIRKKVYNNVKRYISFFLKNNDS